MKRRLQLLALCVTALLAVRLMAQDNGAGNTSGGGGAMDTNGAAGAEPMPSGEANGQNGNGSTTTPGSGDLFAPGTETSGSEGSLIVPGPVPSASPGPSASPTPSASATPVPIKTGVAGQGVQTAPVTLSLPGGYGGGAPKSFVLGEGRLAKPPITYSASVTQGYDDNIFSAPSSLQPTPTPFPFPTPPLERRLIGFRITVPYPPTPVYQTFRPPAGPTPTPAPTPLGIIGSPVTTISLATQIQKGSPRAVIVSDASLGVNDYWNQPGGKIDYTGSFDLSLVYRLTARATLSAAASAVYQKSPNFALINAPTNAGNGGDYLNGTFKVDLSYAWSQRISTVSSYNLDLNLLQTNSQNDLYNHTFGTQFRYTVSPRNTVTGEWRAEYGQHPSNAMADTTSTFYLLGLDTVFSARLRNTFSAGIENHAYSNSGGSSETLPYFESATTFALPRGAALTWTNRYGSEESATPTQNITSYRTGLSFAQPLSAKLVASASIAYNYVETTDSASSAGSSNQKQLQTSLNLAYTVSPRLSLSLSYTYLDFLTSVINSSYQRDQIYLGGTYTFR